MLEMRDVEAGTHSFKIEVAEDDGNTAKDDTGLACDTAVALDNRYFWPFDNDVDSNYRLDSPGLYVDGIDLRTSIFSGGFSPSQITYSGTFNHTDGEQQLRSRKPGKRSQDNTASATFSFDKIEEISSDVQGVIRLGTSGSRSNKSPKNGHVPCKVTDFDISATGNNFPLVNDTNVRNNRLAALTDQTDSTPIFFRADGNEIIVMQRGYLKSNVDLRKASVESTMDIEKAYKSCQVIGKRAEADTGMRFGTQEVKGDIIVAENAPPQVDDHKIIEDKSKTTVKACNESAMAFLEENARIKYDGRVETLPTFAPLGEDIDGAIFSHGEDMMIESVDYSMDQATITFGEEHTFSKQVVEMIKRTNKNSRGI